MFTSYPTYSMAILWNMKVSILNLASTYDPDYAVPLDGDALARSAAARRKNDAAWANLAADVRGRLQIGTASEVSTADRDEYRANMSAHVRTVLTGGDLATLEPTC